MTMRSKEFIGKAEGIKSHELSVKSLIESIKGTLSSLTGKKNSLERELSSLYAELAAAENDYDDDDGPDYGLIASIERQIDQTNDELETTKGDISETNEELEKAEQEYEKVEEEKQQTLFEIQQRARTYSQDIAKIGGAYGAYATIGQSISQSMQANYDALSKAASILDGSIDSIGSGRSSNGRGSGGRKETSATGSNGGAATVAGASSIRPSNSSAYSMKSSQGSAGNSSRGSLKSYNGSHIGIKPPTLTSSQGAIGNGQSRKSIGNYSSNTASSKPLTSNQEKYDSGAISGDGRWIMNTPRTIEEMKKQMPPEQQAYFDSAINAGGGVEGQRAHLRGVGAEYFLTSSSKGRASGNFLTKDHPGSTPQERKENLQLPPGNDASVVEKVRALRATVVLESVIAPQGEWAQHGEYVAREGIVQTFTPNNNINGAIASHIYEIKNNNGIHYSIEPEMLSGAGEKTKSYGKKLKDFVFGKKSTSDVLEKGFRNINLNDITEKDRQKIADVAFDIIKKAYGANISHDRYKEICKNISFLTESEIMKKHPGVKAEASGFYDEKTGKVVIRIGSSDSVTVFASVVIHEFLHGFSGGNNHFGVIENSDEYGNSHNVGLNEGLTEFFTKTAIEKDGTEILFKFSYPELVEIAEYLDNICGRDMLMDAYFHTGISRIKRDFDECFGEKGAFDRFSDKIDDLHTFVYVSRLDRSSKKYGKLKDEIISTLLEYEKRKNDSNYRFRKSMESSVMPNVSSDQTNFVNSTSDPYKEEKQRAIYEEGREL